MNYLYSAFSSRRFAFLLALLFILSLTACQRAQPTISSAVEPSASGSALVEPSTFPSNTSDLDPEASRTPSSSESSVILPNPSSTKEPPKKRLPDHLAGSTQTLPYAELQTELRTLAVQDPSVKLRIPVYEGSDILYQTKHSPLSFYTGLDSGQYRGLYNTRPYVRYLLAFYPTEAIRQRDADTFYFVYDTDDGIRLFVFYSEKNGDGEYDGIQTPVGYPILISKMLSHADFAGIQAGDNAEKIRAIDPVMSVYEDMFFNVYKWNSIAAESYRKENNPIATIHYLRDGLLKIEYDIVDDNRLVVTDLIFDSNYDLTNLYGETYNYRILPQDLPER